MLSLNNMDSKISCDLDEFSLVLKQVCVLMQIHRRTGDPLRRHQIRRNWEYKGFVVYGIQRVPG